MQKAKAWISKTVNEPLKGVLQRVFQGLVIKNYLLF